MTELSSKSEQIIEEAGLHDIEDKDGYKKRCYCEKCVKQYLVWCKKHKDEPHTVCKRKCYTVCEIKCHKTQLTHTEWKRKEEYATKWHHAPCEKAPEKCDKCHKEPKECGCAKKK